MFIECLYATHSLLKPMTTIDLLLYNVTFALQSLLESGFRPIVDLVVGSWLYVKGPLYDL